MKTTNIKHMLLFIGYIMISFSKIECMDEAKISEHRKIGKQLVDLSLKYDVSLHVVLHPFDHGFFYTNLHLLDENSLTTIAGCKPNEPEFLQKIKELEAITTFSSDTMNLEIVHKTTRVKVGLFQIPIDQNLKDHSVHYGIQITRNPILLVWPHSTSLH